MFKSTITNSIVHLFVYVFCLYSFFYFLFPVRPSSIGRGNPSTTSAIWKPRNDFDEMKEPVLSFSSMKSDGAGPEDGMGDAM